jgi:RNA polymerase sigma factor (sigma-70 family)
MDHVDLERERRFNALFREHRGGVVSYSIWRAESPADAQDAVAEVFLIAWRRIDDVPFGSAGRVWLYATARRVIANQRRSTRRRLALRDRLARQPADRHDEMFGTGSRDRGVHTALRRLRSRDREVLLLAEWEGLTAAEIGAVLGCLTVTARGRLHRARSRFRAAYEGLAAAGGPDPLSNGKDDHVFVERTASAQASQPAL